MKANYKIRIRCEEKKIKEIKKNIIAYCNIIKISKESKKRTNLQNRALHLWFNQIEESTKEKGLTIDSLILKPTEFPITKYILKDFFRQLGLIMFHKKSTTKLTTKEFKELIDVCEKEFAKRLDYTEQFPNINNLIYK